MEQNGPFEEEPLALAEMYEYQGADGILLIDCSASDEEHEAAIGRCKEIARNTALTLYMAGNVKRLEDVKKYLYAGAAAVLWILHWKRTRAYTQRPGSGSEQSGSALTPWTAPHPLLPTANPNSRKKRFLGGRITSDSNPNSRKKRFLGGRITSDSNPNSRKKAVPGRKEAGIPVFFCAAPERKRISMG